MGWWGVGPGTGASRQPAPEGTAKAAELAQDARAAAQGLAHLIYLDESELHLLPLVRAMGMKGQRVRVPTPGTNARHAFFGALEAVSGRWVCADHDRKLAIHFVAFLEQLAPTYPTAPLYFAPTRPP